MPKYTDTQLRGEIEHYLLELQERREPMRPQWVAHAVCQSHRDGLAVVDSDHVAFWEYTGYTTTRKFATECINRYDTGLDTDVRPQQQKFPGFEGEYFQAYYVVTRDGDDIGVPIEDCTDDELLAKAAMFRANSRKLLAHAHELERFVEWRRANLRSAS